ncbi:Holliday junction resolvase RuvX [Rickettsiales bacterium LUAb2]
MLHDNLLDFFNNIHNKRILALDISKKHIGVAVSDSNLSLALPSKTIIRTKFLSDIQQIIKLYQDYNCGGIVIGYPILLDNTEGPRCQSIKDFTKLFLTHFEVPIIFENEQFSTRAIKDFYLENNLKNNKNLDSFAAAYFLQTLLDKIKNIQ